MRQLIALSALLLLVGCASTWGAQAPMATRGRHGDNTLNGIAGITLDRSDDGFTIGANYERHLKDRRFGAGGFADVTFGDDTVLAIGPAFYYHPADRWVLLAGPGAEIGDGDSAAFARVGGRYEFPYKDWIISPYAHVDLGLGDAVVFLGVSFGWDF